MSSSGETVSDRRLEHMKYGASVVDAPKIDRRSSDPRYHFDAEQFVKANELILHQRKLLLASMVEKRFAEAAIVLGSILHTIQDFYSHSNYVEMGNTKPYPNLGTEKATFVVAGAHETTCTECKFEGAGWPECHNNLKYLEGRLTSGYYEGQKIDGVPVPKPSINGATNGGGKCSHGEWLDETRKTSATEGSPKMPHVERLRPTITYIYKRQSWQWRRASSLLKVGEVGW